MAIAFYNAQETAQLINFTELTATLKEVVLEYADGTIQSPDRQALTIPDAREGVLLSMPATAHDVCVHKLISLLPDNPSQGRPTIQGIVSVLDSHTGQVVCVLDGPTVTARRTAAMSMLGIQQYLPQAPKTIVMIGVGGQALAHIEAINALFPGVHLYIAARSASLAKAQAVCQRYQDLAISMEAIDVDKLPSEFDVLITLTTALAPIYHLPAKAERLIVAVGAYRPHMCEIAPETVLASRCFVDDIVGAKHEAGDFIQAKKDWSQVQTLAHTLRHGREEGVPILFKTVGTAAWDLAAARVAFQRLQGGAC